jgi:hypothetical protein
MRNEVGNFRSALLGKIQSALTPVATVDRQNQFVGVIPTALDIDTRPITRTD